MEQGRDPDEGHTREPAPEPEPEPAPAPAPGLAPVTAPAPGPASVPVFAHESQPEPNAEPKVEPAPAPAPSIADGVPRTLDPRAVTWSRIVGAIVTAIVAGGHGLAVLILLLTSPPWWVRALVAALWVPVVALLSWLTWRWPEIEHRHTTYAVDAQGIEIRRGVVWRSVVNVPRSRVQHTDVSQGPIERTFGLGRLKIYTAGTENAEVELHGLPHAAALAIRDHLVRAGADDAV